MSERTAAEIGAAGEPSVAGDCARRLVAFVRDLTRYAAAGSESDARRALCSPYSGVPNVDARALCIAAAERHTVADTIAADRVPLTHEATLAARRFARLLGDVREAYRVQGATAREHLTTIELSLAQAVALDGDERATLLALAEVADALDAARPTGAPWEASAFLEALERSLPAARRPPREGALQPLRARLPEPPSPVKRRRAHFSASSLGAFAECARQAGTIATYARRSKTAVPPPRSTARPSTGRSNVSIRNSRAPTPHRSSCWNASSMPIWPRSFERFRSRLRNERRIRTATAPRQAHGTALPGMVRRTLARASVRGDRHGNRRRT